MYFIQVHVGAADIDHGYALMDDGTYKWYKHNFC